ncbi:hypothetical protein RQP46_005323 [Phenoliferia psychrophenolica]
MPSIRRLLSHNRPKCCAFCLWKEPEATSESDAKARFSTCGRCHGPTYCNRDCQKLHWAEHKAQCLFKQRMASVAEEEALLAPALSSLNTDFEAYMDYIELSLDFALHSAMRLNRRDQCSDTHVLRIYLDYDPQTSRNAQPFVHGGINVVPREDAIEDLRDEALHYTKVPDQPIDKIFERGDSDEGEEHDAVGRQHEDLTVIFTVMARGEPPSHAATATEEARYRQMTYIIVWQRAVYYDPRSYFAEEVFTANTKTERNLRKKARKAKAALCAKRAAKLDIVSGIGELELEP